VTLYGEYELKLQHRRQRYMCNSVLFCDLQRPLTVEDYLKNGPIGGLTESACVGAGEGTLTNTVAGTLAMAVTAQPGPQT
jgi:hypothetical protein